MGDSRGRWEGDTLVVEVTNHNDRTWFDMAGNFHSEALKVVERYTLLDATRCSYEATIEDPKVFTRPWKISMPMYRHKDMARVLEYQCQAEKEEAAGDFEREPAHLVSKAMTLVCSSPRCWLRRSPRSTWPRRRPPPRRRAPVRRLPDGKPDLNGFFQSDHGGANWGLEAHKETFTGGRPRRHHRSA